MKLPIIKTTLCCSLAVISSSFGSVTTLSNALNNFNLVVLGDYELRNETEGATFVGGDYTPVSGALNFGFNTGAVNSSENILFLNNGVTGTGQTTLNSGSVISRVAINASSFNTVNGGGGITTGAAPFEAALINSLGISTAAQLTSDIQAASTQITGLSTNGTVSAIQANSPIVFNANPVDINGVSTAVFSIDGDVVFGPLANVGSFQLNTGDATSVIINVSGTNLDIARNFDGFVNDEESIIFNFFEATELEINSNFRGTLLAPLATVTQNVNIDGDVIVNNFIQNAEVHNFGFEGVIPVPEPSALLLLTTGMCFTLRRKRA